jgi:hypothetical protein
MARRTAVIAGLARDVSRTLPAMTRTVASLAARFADHRIVVYESDSRDDTAERLRAWARSDARRVVLSESTGAPRWPSVASAERAHHMAACRNRYLDHVEAHWQDFDHLVVVDWDLADVCLDGIASTFARDDWDAVGANGIQLRASGGRWRPAVYDGWAFRDRAHPEPHGPGEIGPRRYRRGDPWVRLDSCFGGLAIYRMEAVRSGARYGGPDCEHVVFHAGLAAAGHDRLFLNPSQIVRYPTAAPTGDAAGASDRAAR